jgi:hypothetical protein
VANQTQGGASFYFNNSKCIFFLSISAFESQLVSKIVYPSFEEIRLPFLLPTSLIHCVLPFFSIQFCTVILAFRDINLQAVFKIAYKPLARRLSAICIKRHSKVKNSINI